jgi:hypothetical protein
MSRSDRVLVVDRAVEMAEVPARRSPNGWAEEP